MPRRHDERREKVPVQLHRYQTGTMVGIAAASCVALLAMYIGLTVAAGRNNPPGCSPTYSLMVISLVTLWTAPTALSAVGSHVTASVVALLAIASTIYVIAAGKRTC